MYKSPAKIHNFLQTELLISPCYPSGRKNISAFHWMAERNCFRK